MGDRYEKLSDKHIEFINRQHLFFVGTAGREGRVNVSPKGLDTLRVLDDSTIVWLNLTGSGNETAAHVLENQRMTLMFCSFDRQPLILRLYGQAQVIHPRDERWSELASQFADYNGARQFFELHIELVQTSCGFGVPYFEYQGERPTLSDWTDRRTPDEVEAYWHEKNVRSLDGRDTGILQ